MDSCSITRWPFVSGFFDFMCFQVQPCCWVSVLCIPFYGHVIFFCVIIPHFVDPLISWSIIGSFSLFWLLWGMLLWAFMSSSCVDRCFQLSWEWNWVVCFNFLSNCRTVFQSSGTSLHSFPQHRGILVSLRPHWLLLSGFLVTAMPETIAYFKVRKIYT